MIRLIENYTVLVPRWSGARDRLYAALVNDGMSPVTARERASEFWPYPREGETEAEACARRWRKRRRVWE